MSHLWISSVGERGEAVALLQEAAPLLALLRAGAGVLFQAMQGETVLSSALILLSRGGGYDQTTGTSPEGMELGASQFLIFEIAETLRRQGFTAFNLGGIAGQNPGLHTFKSGFGPIERRLEAARFALGSRLRRRLVGAMRSLRARLS